MLSVPQELVRSVRIYTPEMKFPVYIHNESLFSVSPSPQYFSIWSWWEVRFRFEHWRETLSLEYIPSLQTESCVHFDLINPIFFTFSPASRTISRPKRSSPCGRRTSGQRTGSTDAFQRFSLVTKRVNIVTYINVSSKRLCSRLSSNRRIDKWNYDNCFTAKNGL